MSRKVLPKEQLEKMLKTRVKNAHKRYEEEVEKDSKVCQKCNEEKPLSQFSSGRKYRDGRKRYGYCNVCHALDQRIRTLKTNFNLTPTDYDKIVDYQNGLCAICGNPPKKVRLNVDHDHKTGLIRGALCFMCNRVLGLFRDNLERFNKAMLYLDNPPAPYALGEARYGVIGKIGKKKRKNAPDIFKDLNQYQKERGLRKADKD